MKSDNDWPQSTLLKKEKELMNEGILPYVDLSTILPVWEKSSVAVPNSPSSM